MVSRPAITRSRVDFPQPDGPSTTRNSLAPISSETSSSTTVLPKRLLTPLSARFPTLPPAVVPRRRIELVIVAGDTPGAGGALVFDSGFQHRAGVHLAYDCALHLLPRRLAIRVHIAAGGFQIPESLLQFGFADQSIDLALPEVDAQATAGAQNRKTAADRRFRRCMQD